MIIFFLLCLTYLQVSVKPLPELQTIHQMTDLKPNSGNTFLFLTVHISKKRPYLTSRTFYFEIRQCFVPVMT